MSAQELITDHLDLWTGATKKKSNSGRGTNGKVELTGIKRLRELILELAIRGKLVEQDFIDKPASFLLEQINSEKQHLIKQGEIKKRRKLPTLTDMTIPFHLPPNWEWAQLEDLGRDWGQKSPVSDFSYIDVASVDNVRGITTMPSILSADEAPSRARKLVRPGTVIYSTVRPYLQNIAVVEGEFSPEPIASTAFAIFYPLSGMPARFFLHYLRSPTFVRYVESVQTGIAYPAINDKQFFSGLAPVPPLEEQHRIVQKVDELMALCDRLEQQTSDQIAAHDTLVDTLLGTLTQSQNATELAENWTRLAAHFDTLFTTEQSIDKLKQTIIELSIRGFLVPTSKHCGESSNELLSRLRDEKRRLIAAKTARDSGKTHQKAPIKPPYDLPKNWLWVRFRELIWCYRGHNPPKAEFKDSLLPGYVRFIQITDFKTDTKKVFIPQSPRNKMVHRGEIIMAAYRHIGKLSREMEGAFNVALCKILEFEPMNRDFVELLIHTDLVTGELLRASERGHIPSMHSDHLLSLLVPLPPLEQQQKIVSKVRELLSLCDQLKERLSQANKTRCQLAETIVATALQ